VEGRFRYSDLKEAAPRDYGWGGLDRLQFAVAVRALGFQERVAERTGVGKRIRESESHHHIAF
jgi:hypothetical protein